MAYKVAFTLTLAVAFVAIASGGCEDRSTFYSSSCANHAIQLMEGVRWFLRKKEPFPKESDARKAFSLMLGPEEAANLGLDGPGAACPEAFRRDRSMGYIFLADGLQFRAERSDPPLVFICPAESHQGSDQHCHACKGGELECLQTNPDMIALLEREIARGERGAVHYSPRALECMRREAESRRRIEAKRGH
jgi:hypothetical protein